MSLGKDSKKDLLRFYGEVLKVSELETLFGIQIDNKLNLLNLFVSKPSKN